MSTAMDRPRTMFEKIWADHAILEDDDGQTLLFVGRHLAHDGSMHPFRFLDERGQSVMYPDQVFATPDHGTPTVSHRLEDIAEYYVAYDRLQKHWGEVLKDRVIEVEYENLVSDPENQIRLLLDKLGLEFESACLDFHLNQAPSATASAAQVREKTHTRSVNKWKNWESQLQPLKAYLENAGIE